MLLSETAAMIASRRKGQPTHTRLSSSAASLDALADFDLSSCNRGLWSAAEAVRDRQASVTDSELGRSHHCKGAGCKP